MYRVASYGGHKLRTLSVAAAAITALSLAPRASADEPELRIGYMNTTSGPGAIIGTWFSNGWALGLEHQGWRKDGDKLGGVPTRIFYADDQLKTDVAVREIERFIKNDKVHVVAGILWTNIMVAVHKRVLDAKLALVSTNASSTALAGEDCSPLFVSTSWSNEDVNEAAGEVVQKEGLKTVVLMAPNYQGGHDSIRGFLRNYKGKVLEQIMFKLGESDFQAELAKVRAVKPEGVFVFAPGAMGIAFIKQWKASGIGESIKLYSVFMIDYATLPAIGDAAVGSVHAQIWDPASADPRSQRFLKDYVAKFGQMPSDLAIHAYDATTLIADGVRAAGGKIDDAAALVRAMRKGGLSSVRGDLRYNVNGYLIQPFYSRTVIRDSDGRLTIKVTGKLSDHRDSYWEKCPAERRI
jgi:branched-chain amino acid transport system substrate-binding protein